MEGRIGALGLAPDGSLRDVAAFGDLLEQPGERVPETVGQPSGQIRLTTPAVALPDSGPWAARRARKEPP